MSPQKHDKLTKHVGLESSNSTINIWLFRVPALNLPYLGCPGVVVFFECIWVKQGDYVIPPLLGFSSTCKHMGNPLFEAQDIQSGK